jgi:hypothetical protein
MWPLLKSTDFPAHVLTEERLEKALDGKRIASIRRALVGLDCKEDVSVKICYVTPWYDRDVIPPCSVDIIFSHAVMEHVDDLSATYGTLASFMKPRGFMSYSVDFRSHGVTSQWNGMWTHSEFAWRLMRGARPYWLNRLPHSAHISLLEKNGLKVVCDVKVTRRSDIERKSLARAFKGLSDDDLATERVFIQAVKP